MELRQVPEMKTTRTAERVNLPKPNFSLLEWHVKLAKIKQNVSIYLPNLGNLRRTGSWSAPNFQIRKNTGNCAHADGWSSTEILNAKSSDWKFRKGNNQSFEQNKIFVIIKVETMYHAVCRVIKSSQFEMTVGVAGIGNHHRAWYSCHI